MQECISVPALARRIVQFQYDYFYWDLLDTREIDEDTEDVIAQIESDLLERDYVLSQIDYLSDQAAAFLPGEPGLAELFALISACRALLD